MDGDARRAGSGTAGRRAAALFLAAAVLPLAAAPARAGGFHTPDFGVRRNAMLAVVGKPDDLACIYHNPAGLTLMEGTQVYLTAQATFVNLGFKFYDSQGNLRGTRDGNRELTPDQSWGVLPFLGVASDFGTKRLRAGLAAYAPALYGADLPDDEATRYHLLKGFFGGLHLTGTLAYKVTDRMAIGAGISAVYLYQQGSQILNPLVNQKPDLRWSDSDAVRAQDVHIDLKGQGWTWDWNVGLLFHPLPTLGLGFTFISGAKVKMDGDLVARTRAGAPVKVGQQTRFSIPFTLRAGINWEFVKGVEVGLDWTYWHYQVLQEEVRTFKEPLLGMKEQRTPKLYENAWNVSVGLAYRPLPVLELMAGYQHDKTPIPSRTLTLDNITRDLDGIAVGLRWQAVKWLKIGVAYQRTWYHVLNIQDSVQTPPVNGKGHGDMHHATLDLAFRL